MKRDRFLRQGGGRTSVCKARGEEKYRLPNQGCEKIGSRCKGVEKNRVLRKGCGKRHLRQGCEKQIGSPNIDSPSKGVEKYRILRHAVNKNKFFRQGG